MSAVVILCIMAIRNPMNEAAANDMRLVGDVMQIFKSLDEAYGSNTYLTQVQKVCQELYRKAHYAVQSLNAQLVDSIDVESHSTFDSALLTTIISPPLLHQTLNTLSTPVTGSRSKFLRGLPFTCRCVPVSIPPVT